MQATGANKLSDLPLADAALRDLCRPFLKDAESFRPEVVIVQPDEIPYPQDQLLVHHDHMTLVLEKHHGSPVNVTVQEVHNGGPIYTRKISLAPRNQPGKIVEWGIVRLDFRYMDPVVRDEILGQKLPLGAVLIKHDVLRRIKPRWFIRCPADGPMVRLFGRPTTPDEIYGRIGTIYCNDEPAIQLVELVLNCEPSPPYTQGGEGRVRGGT